MVLIHIRLLSFVLTSTAQGFHGISMFLSCFTFKFSFCMVLLVFHFFHVLIDLGVVVLCFSCHFYLFILFFIGGVFIYYFMLLFLFLFWFVSNCFWSCHVFFSFDLFLGFVFFVFYIFLDLGVVWEVIFVNRRHLYEMCHMCSIRSFEGRIDSLPLSPFRGVC